MSPILGATGFGGGATSLYRAGGMSGWVATGGDIYDMPDGSTIHMFTSSGSLVVKNLVGDGSDVADILVIAGGGCGGGDDGGGGGAGGVVDAPGYPMALATYPIVVGEGGVSSSPPTSRGQGLRGGDSEFKATSDAANGKLTSKGGGGGGEGSQGTPTNCPGGSGGGHGYAQSTSQSTGTQPGETQYPGTTNQYGYGGGGWMGPPNSDSPIRVMGGGGGGAGGSGQGGPPTGGTSVPGGNGGNGRAFPAFPGPHFAAPNSPTGSDMPTNWQSAVTPNGIFAGGGGGGSRNPSIHGKGGTGGAGEGGYHPQGHGEDAIHNTGSGGGGDDGTGNPGGLGGDGIVIVHFKV